MSCSGCSPTKRERELARAGLAVAPRLGEAVIRGAGDSEGRNEAVIERIRRRLAVRAAARPRRRSRASDKSPARSNAAFAAGTR